MSTREIDLGASGPLIELAEDAPLARVRPDTAPVIALPRRPEPVRFSRLKRMDDSALHYAQGIVEETSPMRKGTALHAFMLGQKDRVCVYRDGVRNDKAEKFQAFKKENPNKHILIPSEEAQVIGMRRSLERHARAMELLEGEQECRIEWDFSGRRCAGTPDVWRDLGDHRRVVELKATRCAKPARLIKHARWSYWHSQVSWYSDGLDRVPELPPLPCTDHYLIAVEMVEPWPVTVLHVTPGMIAAGARQWRSWWEKLRVCEEANHWPAYTEADVEWEDTDPNGSDDADGLDWGDGEDVAAE